MYAKLIVSQDGNGYKKLKSNCIEYHYIASINLIPMESVILITVTICIMAIYRAFSRSKVWTPAISANCKNQSVGMAALVVTDMSFGLFTSCFTFCCGMITGIFEGCALSLTYPIINKYVDPTTYVYGIAGSNIPYFVVPTYIVASYLIRRLCFGK